MKRFKTWRTGQGAALLVTLVVFFVLVKIIDLIILPFVILVERCFKKPEEDNNQNK